MACNVGIKHHSAKILSSNSEICFCFTLFTLNFFIVLEIGNSYPYERNIEHLSSSTIEASAYHYVKKRHQISNRIGANFNPRTICFGPIVSNLGILHGLGLQEDTMIYSSPFLLSVQFPLVPHLSCSVHLTAHSSPN